MQTHEEAEAKQQLLEDAISNKLKRYHDKL